MERPKYLIEYEEGIRDKLKSILKTMRERIKRAIEERLMTNPIDYGKPLTREWKDYRRIRVGDYRVIYKVFEDKVIVLIVEVDHRKDVYG